MFTRQQLQTTLARLEGRPFPAYRDLTGSFACGRFILHVDHVQPDPFAPPSRLRVVLTPGAAPGDRLARLGQADFLLRAFGAALPEDGPWRLDRPGQEILERSAAGFEAGQLVLRLGIELPAEGRRIDGRRAARLLLEELPAAVDKLLHHDAAALEKHLNCLYDWHALQRMLAERGWVAFVADGALLPREGGGGDRPLRRGEAVPFRAPEGLAATVELPHAGRVHGMGLGTGLSLIVGGGHQGKSTLLRALAHGVYPHAPGDGRERVASLPGCVVLRSEDGRPVTGVDVRGFVRFLPGGADPAAYSTRAASGSTSQAANLAEALEMGASCLLVDEDTAAANFLSRDVRMQALVPVEAEPIVPFVDRVDELRRRGVSTVLVAGGCGAFLDQADRVLYLEGFACRDETAAARQVAARLPDPRQPEAAGALPPLVPRVPLAASFPVHLRLRPRGTGGLAHESGFVDLSPCEQLVDAGQVRALADLVLYAARRYMDGRRSLREVLADVYQDVERQGLGVLWPNRGQAAGDYVLPRPFEAAGAINRLPFLKVKPPVVPESEGERRPARGPAADRKGTARPRGFGAAKEPHRRGSGAHG